MAESSVSKGFGMGLGCCLSVLFIIALSVLIPTCGVIGLIGLGSAVDKTQLRTASVPSHSEADAIYKASSEVLAIQEAKKFVAGTWSETPQNLFWQKWVIQANGTVLAYTANENDNDWGEPKTYDWEIAKQTYSDTGKGYYAFHATGRSLSDGALNAVIEEDGRLTVVNADLSESTMRRGDGAHFKGTR